MTSPPLVSVVIPCHNAAAFLPGTIRSVRTGASLTDIIIVDDASTDDSALLAAKLAATHPSTRLIRRIINGGPAAARNTGLQAATGRYICFLDADDEYAPGFLSHAARLLDGDPTIAGVVTGVELIESHRPVDPVQLDALARSIPTNLQLRRAVVEAIGGFSEDPGFRRPFGGEDIAFRTALARHFRLSHIPQPYLRYRVRPGGHFDRFLDRSSVINGELVFNRQQQDEHSRAYSIAHSSYLNRVQERLRSLAGLAKDETPGSDSAGVWTVSMRCANMAATTENRNSEPAMPAGTAPRRTTPEPDPAATAITRLTVAR